MLAPQAAMKAAPALPWERVEALTRQLVALQLAAAELPSAEEARQLEAAHLAAPLELRLKAELRREAAHLAAVELRLAVGAADP